MLEEAGDPAGMSGVGRMAWMSRMGGMGRVESRRREGMIGISMSRPEVIDE